MHVAEVISDEILSKQVGSRAGPQATLITYVETDTSTLGLTFPILAL